MARVAARGVAPQVHFWSSPQPLRQRLPRPLPSGFTRSKACWGALALAQGSSPGLISPDRESSGNPRFPLTSAHSSLPAAGSSRLGEGGGGPHPRTSEPRQPTRYLHVEEDIYRSLGKPAADRSFQSEIRLLLLLFCPVQRF